MSMTTETVIDRGLPLAGLLMVATIWFAGTALEALRPLMRALRPRMTRRILRRCLRGCLKVIFVGKPLRTFPDHAVV